MAEILAPLYLVFPFLNEAPNIPGLLEAIEVFAESSPEYLVRILAVDDGSTDGGGALIREHREVCSTEVIANGTNLGPGHCFARAFSILAGRLGPDDLVVTMEADNTSGLDTLSRMLVRIKEGYGAVLASPYSYGGGFGKISSFRVIISHLANGMVKLLLGLRGLNTFSSFFRLYRGKTIKHLQEVFGPEIIESKGFECMVEILYKMALAGTTISEVEFKLDWSNRRGKSKMKIMRTIRGYLRVFSSHRRWRRASQLKHRENTEGTENI